MGIFIRKSKKIGPFRLNLSKAGLGVSTRVPGARVSVGPSGTFVHIGREGLYYRKKLASKNKGKKYEQEVNLNEVFIPKDNKTIYQTTNFNGITDIDSEDFINTLIKNDSKVFLYKWLGILPLILAVSFILIHNSSKSYHTELVNKFEIETEAANLRSSASSNGEILRVINKGEVLSIDSMINNWIAVHNEESRGFIYNGVGKITQKQVQVELYSNEEDLPLLPLLGFVPLLIGLYIYDIRRKRVDIYYSMDADFEGLYNQQKQCFREFQISRKIWQMKTSQKISNSKYHAGASSLVKRISIKKTEKDSLPTPLIKTNVEIPHISLSNVDLYFFPERLILKQNGRFAAVLYKNLKITKKYNRFIEEEGVPQDASVIDITWKYVNKNGGPDRRFKSNKKIPICQYSEYHIECQNGVNEIIMTSKTGGMDKFSEFVNIIGDYQLKFDKN